MGKKLPMPHAQKLHPASGVEFFIKDMDMGLRQDLCVHRSQLGKGRFCIVKPGRGL
ncbi:MAG: hypothetical protein V7K64_23565 [Nostoc sp.]|uniref:hypothetical protein n=1 Tax=Nostoc sp. TaxID=1180 RepID=UPI002FF5D85D